MKQLGHNGAALIQLEEQLRLVAFKPIPTDPWTIGFGHTSGVCQGLTCTPQQANKWFTEDTQEVCNTINACVRVPLTQNQFDALVSWAYNVGCGAAKTSTLVSLLNQKHYDQVPLQLARWNKSAGKVLAGLTNRRAAEAKLWNTPDE